MGVTLVDVKFASPCNGDLLTFHLSSPFNSFVPSSSDAKRPILSQSTNSVSSFNETEILLPSEITGGLFKGSTLSSKACSSINPN